MNKTERWPIDLETARFLRIRNVENYTQFQRIPIDVVRGYVGEAAGAVAGAILKTLARDIAEEGIATIRANLRRLDEPPRRAAPRAGYDGTYGSRSGPGRYLPGAEGFVCCGCRNFAVTTPLGVCERCVAGIDRVLDGSRTQSDTQFMRMLMQRRTVVREQHMALGEQLPPDGRHYLQALALVGIKPQAPQPEPATDIGALALAMKQWGAE